MLTTVFDVKEPHHYKTTNYSFKPIDTVETRDSIKQIQAQQQGITLITVPFWWDRTPHRFIAFSSLL
jgi:hypothetical protein